MTSTTVKGKNRKKNKSSTNENSELKQFAIAILKGFAAGTAFLFILLSIFSIIMVKFDYSEKSIPIMALTSTVLAAFVAGYWATKCIKKKGLMIGIITSIPLAIAVTAFVAVANEGTIGPLAVTAVLIMIGMGGFGGVVSVNKKARKAK